MPLNIRNSCLKQTELIIFGGFASNRPIVKWDSTNRISVYFPYILYSCLGHFSLYIFQVPRFRLFRISFFSLSFFFIFFKKLCFFFEKKLFKNRKRKIGCENLSRSIRRKDDFQFPMPLRVNMLSESIIYYSRSTRYIPLNDNIVPV